MRHPIVKENLHTVAVEYPVFCFFQLIQSQSQAGAASTET